MGGIVGPNGAGKTTLLTVVNGLGKITRGHCYIHQEVAFQVILWFMLLAINLFWPFLYGNRRSYKNSDFSAREIAGKMRNALEYIRDRSLAK